MDGYVESGVPMVPLWLGGHDCGASSHFGAKMLQIGVPRALLNHAGLRRAASMSGNNAVLVIILQ